MYLPVYLHSNRKQTVLKIKDITSRSRAAVARRAHNPKVGSSILPFATKSPSLIFNHLGFFIFIYIFFNF